MQRQDTSDFNLIPTFETDQLQQQQQQQQQMVQQQPPPIQRPSINIITSLPPASSMTPLARSPSAQLPSPLRSYRTSAYQWPVPTTPTRMCSVTPTTANPLSATDWSVKDIIDLYKDDPEALKTVLTAKAEEDKRRTAEESYKAEQLRLQWKQVELEIIREQNRSGMVASGGRFGTGSGAPTPTNAQPPPNPFRVSSPEYPSNGYMASSPSTLIPPEIIHTAPPISPVVGPTYSTVYQPIHFISGQQIEYAPAPPTHTTITLNQPTIPNRNGSQQQQQQQQQPQQQQQQQPQPHSQTLSYSQAQGLSYSQSLPYSQSQVQSYPQPQVPSQQPPYYHPPQQDYHPQASYAYSNGYNALSTPTSANSVRQLAHVTTSPQHLPLPPTPSHNYPVSPSEYGTLTPLSATSSPRSPNASGHKRKRGSTSSHHGFVGDKIDRSTSPSESKIKKECEDDDAPKLTHDQVMEAVRNKVLRGVTISNAAEKGTGETEKTANGSNSSHSPSPRIKRSPSITSPHNFPNTDDPSSSRSPALTATTQSPHLSVKSPLISPSAANVMLSPRVGMNTADGAEDVVG